GADGHRTGRTGQGCVGQAGLRRAGVGCPQPLAQVEPLSGHDASPSSPSRVAGLMVSLAFQPSRTARADGPDEGTAPVATPRAWSALRSVPTSNRAAYSRRE